MEGGWVGVKVPMDVAGRIDARLRVDGTYRSRGELVKAAVIWFLEARAAGMAAPALEADAA